MPTNPFRQINGPEGPINFPGDMSDEQVTQAMQRLYPPKSQLTPGNVPEIPAPSLLAKIGSYVPEWTMPGLAAAKKYAVDPFENLAQRGAQMGREVGRGWVQGASGGASGMSPSSRQIPLTMEETERQHPIATGIAGGIGATVGSIVADPRNWPLMGSGAVRPVLQKLMTRGFTAMMAKGTYDAASQLYKNWDNLTPSQRTELGTQSGLSALMTAGLASHWSGSTAGSEVIDQGAKLKEQFGKETRPLDTPAKPAMSAEEIRSRIKAAEIQNVAMREGPVPESSVEQARRRAPEKPTEPQVNQVPEAVRASTIIAKAEQTKLAERIESRAAEKKALEKPIEATPVDVETTKLKSVAQPVRDTSILTQLKAEHPEWTLSQQLQEAARRVNPPTGAKALEEKLKPIGVPERPADISERIFRKGQEYKTQGLQDVDTAFRLMKDFPEQADQIAKAYGYQETRSPGVGEKASTSEAPKSEVKPPQATQPAQRPGESVRATTQPEVEDRSHPFYQLVDDFRKGVVYHGTTKELGAKIRTEGIEGLSYGKIVKRVAEKMGVDIHTLTQAQKDELGDNARTYNNQIQTASVAHSPEIANRWAGKGGEIAARVAAILGKKETMEDYTITKGEPEVLRGQLTEKGLQNPNYQRHLKSINRIEADVKAGITPINEANVLLRNEYRDIRVRPEDVSFRSEPRSLRGDLGERPPLSKQPALPDMNVFRERVAKWQEEHPGVSKSRAQEVISEQMRKERGSVGGSEFEEPSMRRERKINDWIGQLRDEGSNPEVLDNAWKMLQAYGLDHNEIIRRVSGTEGFAETPAIEERMGSNKDLDAKADGLIGGLIDTVDKRMGESAPRFAGQEGDAKIPGVKRPGDEELERMFNLKDERGFWTMWPAKKAKPIRPGNSTLDELTAKLESSMRATAPDDSRMRIAERLDKAVTEDWDKTQIALGRVAAQAVAIKDMYMREPEITDYRSSIGRFSGALNRSAWELRQFAKAIKEKVPDQRRREAITNWIQAGGDDAILADRAARSKGSLRAGYEAARTLTQDEQGIAKFVTSHFDKRLKDAIKMDVLQEGLENYVPQIWKPKDQQNISNFFSSLHRGDLLKPDFNSARKRVFDSYFEGEQTGRVPVNKDIGFLVASWDKAFNQAIASRALIRDLSKGTAEDGRPIIAPSGSGKAVYDVSSPIEGDKPEAYFIFPKATEEETGDYVSINHPALRKWTWASKDADGAPIFVKGDLRVHPKSVYTDASGRERWTDNYSQKLDNVMNRGRWAANHTVQSAILKGQAFFKATLLSMSPFHQIQEGTHAIFHKVNPFNPPQIDLANPSMGKLLDHGLVIGNFDPVAAFEEGLTSGGLVGKVPGIGPFMQKYSEYLFQDYIPRLKAQMAVEAYERNIHRYQGQVAKGDITTNQIAELTANQANAAFGELNYITMGRNPQTQAILRMMFLAPDFLEARVRFAGQALRPYGREQYSALLLRGGLGMYVTARILNQVLDDDPHWDKPFSLVVKGYEYKMRTLPGDIWHLIEDPNSFLLHRLNPTLVKPFMEMATGKDDFGRRRNAGEQTMDFIRGLTPIPTQGLFKSGGEDPLSGVLSGFGVTRSKYRTKAGALAHQYAIGSNTNDVTTHHISELVQDITTGKLDSNKIADLLVAGKMNPKDLQTAVKMAALPELYRDFHRLPVELKAKVFAAATDEERAQLLSYSRKEMDMTRLLPEQRQQLMKDYARQ